MKGSSPVGALSLYTAGGPQEAVHADVSMARILSLWEISPRAAWTDQEQHELMAADLQGTVFRCWANIAETVIHSEIGSSVAIREAGFNLDSLMLRYQVTPCCYCCTRQAINPLHQPTPCISIPYTWHMVLWSAKHTMHTALCWYEWWSILNCFWKAMSAVSAQQRLCSGSPQPSSQTYSGVQK